MYFIFFEARRAFISIIIPSRSLSGLEVTHRDLSGPIDHKTLDCRKYLPFLINDFIRMMSVYILKKNSKAFEAFKIFKSLENSNKLLRNSF